MEDKKRPTEENLDKFTLGSACSANECTGLVTHYATEDEMEAYMDVYPYQAKPCGADDEENIDSF